MARLEGKIAIVTGGAKGIGRHYSQALAAEGARVMIADIADGKELAAEIAGRHGADTAHSITFDVTDETAIKNLVAQTIERFGQIDVLVNNAAYYSTLKPRNFNEWDTETWDRVMAVNVRGSYLMVRHVAPHMIARKSGKIINIASGAAYKGVPRMLPYVTSKGAILAFTRSLSRELAPRGVRVNILGPGLTLTDRTAGSIDSSNPTGAAPAGVQTPFSRPGEPGEVADVAVFLASDEARWVTTQIIYASGGAIYAQ